VAYRVLVAPSASRDLKRLDRSARDRVDRALDLLADEPRPPACKRLTGAGELYRVRVGSYRIVYEIRDDVLIVLVVRVGHRRDVYRDL
jgi:mRNA interferase RelE/StbE